MTQEIIDLAIQDRKTVYDKGQKGSIPGLHLRPKQDGSATWTLYYKTRDGKERRPKIGPYPALTLADARKLAKELLFQVLLGKDPSGEWRASKGLPSVSEVFDKFYAQHYDKPRYRESGWGKKAREIFKKHVEPRFGERRINDVTKSEVLAWHANLSDHPVVANRALQVFSLVFKHAISKDLIEKNPCMCVRLYPEKKRKRVASHEERARILEFLRENQNKNPKAVAFLLTLMFTGARPKSIERARWDQIEVIHRDGVESAILHFKGKSTAATGETEAVAIPSKLFAHLKSLREGDGLIFGIGAPKHLWRRMSEELGIEGLWMRDLRRTFASVALEAGESIGLIGELLNHHDVQTTKRYAKLFDAPRVAAVERISDALLPLGRTGPLS